MDTASHLQPGNGYQLPRQAYYDEVWLDRELDQLFPATWNLAATTHELVEPGDTVCVTVGRQPLIVVRGHDGEIRAFHNICRHRGALLLTEGATCSTIRCPYHGWDYATDGTLRIAPQSGEQLPDLDKSDWGLLPVNCEIWRGLIFVNPDGRAPDLHAWLGTVDEDLGPFRPDTLTKLVDVEHELAVNWKLYVENHLDWYHLWYTHADTLGSVPHHLGVQRHHGRHWTSFTPTGAELAETIDFEPLAGVPERCHGIGAHLVFPNLLVFTGAGYFVAATVTPTAPDRSSFRVRLFAAPEQDPSGFMAGFDYVARAEDEEMAKRLQATVRSPAFGVGPMALGHEVTLTHFHDTYLAHVSDPAHG